ncbi:proteinase T-like protein [Xylariomycetidae sp. FL0641]|nr:proteinase T-like protein [Xylariomycetidae sp. FL0641]
MRFTSLLLALPLALAAPAKRSSPAPVLKPRDAPLIEGKYIVKLYGESTVHALNNALSLMAAEADHVYNVADFKGFAGALDPSQVEALQAHPDVEYIEQDAKLSINTYVTQQGATWGISRISHREGTNGYVYDDSAGAGTCAYIIDTGIYTSHPDFDGRASFLANFVDGSDTDGNGHGTHVAGTVGSATYGVAKQTTLYAVKVLDAGGSGTTSGVIAGMDFVTADAGTRSDCPNGYVANMSLGGGVSTALNSAAAAMINAGVFLAVAAGNDNANAANTSPASEASVCTVGATTSADARASFSNYGAVVDVFAPGQDVTSLWNNGGTNTISGTSMASPHITGLGAYLLALEGRRDPQALCSYIASIATPNVLSNIPSGTVNLLAFNDNPSG